MAHRAHVGKLESETPAVALGAGSQSARMLALQIPHVHDTRHRSKEPSQESRCSSTGAGMAARLAGTGGAQVSCARRAAGHGCSVRDLDAAAPADRRLARVHRAKCAVPSRSWALGRAGEPSASRYPVRPKSAPDWQVAGLRIQARIGQRSAGPGARRQTTVAVEALAALAPVRDWSVESRLQTRP